MELHYKGISSCNSQYRRKIPEDYAVSATDRVAFFALLFVIQQYFLAIDNVQSFLRPLYPVSMQIVYYILVVFG